jgi:pilus assembly protein CpaB
MWKVKRMDTARIVVLTTADGTGGIAAYLANRPDSTPLPAGPVARLPAIDALVAKGEPIKADGADLMAPVLSAGIRAPSLTKTLK